MKKKKQTLLWKITPPVSKHSSYVFGTMHVRDSRAFHYWDEVVYRMKACDVYAGEVNIDEMDQSVLANMMDLPEGQLLSTLLKPKIYKRLNRIMEKEIGIPLSFFDNSQPILISNLISEKVLSTDMPDSLDATLWNYAKSLERITVGIESFAEQTEILSQLSLEYQLDSLSWLARNFGNFRRQLRQMTKLYEKSDIVKLYRLTRKQSKGMRKILLFNRNRLMAERIANIAQEQSLFASIGAGHLAGEKGVLRLLKHQYGFKVKPVKNKERQLLQTD